MQRECCRSGGSCSQFTPQRLSQSTNEAPYSAVAGSGWIGYGYAVRLPKLAMAESSAAIDIRSPLGISTRMPPSMFACKCLQPPLITSVTGTHEPSLSTDQFPDGDTDTGAAACEAEAAL